MTLEIRNNNIPQMNSNDKLTQIKALPNVNPKHLAALSIRKVFKSLRSNRPNSL